MPDHFDAGEVKRRLAFLDLMAHAGVVMRKSGANWVASCPFHQERSASFTVHGPEHDHGHCYGCGWNGDVFDFWRERAGGGFPETVAALASLAAVPPTHFDGLRRRQSAAVADMTNVSHDRKEKPQLPRLRALTDKETEQLARLRHLDYDGVAIAAAERRVGACVWPQFLDRNGAWRVADDAALCWVITDKERRVAQFRRMDGEAFTRKDGKPIKCWTKGSPTWPVGAAEIGERYPVLLVEGGADLLAAYHFLERFDRVHPVAVVAMLGASMRIAEEALPYFARRRVRIMRDVDEPKDERGIQPGLEAAARWTAQLTNAGAAVETFSLAGLMRRDGERVKDLNDLALVDEAAWMDPELRAAFLNFDF